MSSIAAQFGFLWQTLWDLNPDLKLKRDNPNVLLPGDIVVIPELRVYEASKPVDQKHVFVLKGTQARFRLIVERSNIAMADRRFILTIDGTRYSGVTDDTGALDIPIKPNARSGLLRLPDDQIECQLHLGCLDPIEETTGVQSRLHNLGFYRGDPDGKMSNGLGAAIGWFQASVDMAVTREIDEATLQKLSEMHDKPHPQRQEEPPPAEPSA